MKLTVTIHRSPPPPDGDFAIVLHDVQMLGVSRPTRNNAPRRTLSLPETDPYASLLSRLDHSMQKWLHELSVEAAGGNMSIDEQAQSFHGVWQFDTAFTNEQPDLHYSKTGDPYEANPTINLYNVLTGGTIIKLLGKTTNYKGTLSLPFQVMDTSKDYQKYHPSKQPWLFFNPVSSHRKEIWQDGRWTGKYQEDLLSTFWTYRGKTVLPIHGRPLPNTPSGVAYIDASLVRILERGKPWPGPIDL